MALLIGNEDYADKELQGLRAPSNDVVTLTHILESLDFHVIALHNLTRTEMYNAFQWFCRVLPKNAYGQFSSNVQLYTSHKIYFYSLVYQLFLNLFLFGKGLGSNVLFGMS